MTVEVKVHQVFLTVRGKDVRLTKDRARQFGIRHHRGYVLRGTQDRSTRMMLGLPVPRPICKVQAKVLDRDLIGWLILIPDEEEGLVWVRPAYVPPRNQERIRDEGGSWDVLAEIPTVIF